MFCINCGEKLVEGAKFCSNCGTNLTAILGQGQEKEVLTEVVSTVQMDSQNGRMIAVTSDKPAKRDTDFIARSCRCVKIDDLYCEIGNPTILQSSRKYQKAKDSFNIPDNEDIFLIYDDTVLGSCAKGFALCTSGCYYSGDMNRKGYIPWERFASINISTCFGGIVIDQEVFTPNYRRAMMTILESIQDYLR